MTVTSNTVSKKSLLITSSFWQERLSLLSHPSAIRMAEDLDANGVLGIGCAEQPFWKGFKHNDGKKDSNIDFLIRVKKQHPEKIVIVQIGEFYETWGIESVFLVEYCGLNRMGRRGVRAGTPLANIQKVLDDLTAVGFSVVICEQADDSNKTGRKTRFVAEIVTPSSPVYTHGLAMDKARSDTFFPDSPPEFGLVFDKRGVTVVEINPDLCTVLTLEGLTTEAAVARLSRYGGRFSHVFYHENVEQKFLELCHLKHEHLVPITTYLPRDFARRMEELIKINLNLDVNHPFTQVHPIQANDEITPRPLYLNSAEQMGILSERGIPQLVDFMLPKGSPVTCENLLKHFLLSPPPKSIANDIRQSLKTLMTIESALPEFPVANPARYVKTLQKQEAGPEILRDLFNIAESFLFCYQSAQSWALEHTLRVVSHSLNFVVQTDSLATVSELIVELLAPVLPNGEDVAYVSTEPMISKHLFEYIEQDFRGHVAITASNDMTKAYQRVKRAAVRYEKALVADLIPLVQQREQQRQENKKLKPWALSFDIHNKAVWLRGPIRSDLKHILANKQDLYHPIDRYGKEVKDLWTTARAEKYLNEYKAAAEQARVSVSTLLSDISKQLSPHSLPIAHLATYSNLMRTFLLHAKACKTQQWGLDVSYDSSSRLELKEFFPYWMSAYSAVKNSLALNDMAVLTGHNMAGKSTAIRSAAVVSLLASAGFMFPAKQVVFGDVVDGWYLRTGSYDDPEAGLSTFAVEMNDITIALRDASANTLILIDELGKGTETRSGHAIAGSILEYLQAQNIRGIFSTHWHELFFNKAVRLDTMQMISMAMDKEGKPNYKIEEGGCLTSSAYHTASELGLSQKIIARAQEIESSYAQTEQNQTIADSNAYLKVAEEPVGYEVYSLTKVSHLLSEVTQQPLEKVKHIASKKQAPLVDNGESVVYILRTRLGFYYVGETDNIDERIKAHRQVEAKKHCEFVYMVIPLGKSAARKCESILIKQLALLGFPLLSVDDARHQHFGSV